MEKDINSLSLKEPKRSRSSYIKSSFLRALLAVIVCYSGHTEQVTHGGSALMVQRRLVVDLRRLLLTALTSPYSHQLDRILILHSELILSTGMSWNL